MTNHRNDERTVRCPVEGCDATPLARGINLHLNRSNGDGHGPRGEVPDHISTDDLETVGAEAVEMDYPEERDTENVARLCPYCSRPCKGKNGVLIHLGQVAGRKNHPENAAKAHSQEDFPIVEVDEKGNITSVPDEAVSVGDIDPKKGVVPVQQVYQFIAELVADDKRQTARRVRSRLLGEDIGARPYRKVIPHRDLYEALLGHRFTDQPTDSISATVREGGIRVECHGESAVYTPDEALDIAAGLEQATDESEKHKDTRDLIEFLRHAVEELENTQMKGNYHEDFQRWR